MDHGENSHGAFSKSLASMSNVIIVNYNYFLENG